MVAEGERVPDVVLDVQGLTKRFVVGALGRRRVVRALSDVDLTLARGEVLALVGESGSGKTTAARALAYLDPADAGEIRLHGKLVPRRPDSRRLAQYRREVQMIFQDPYASLDPLQTVGHTIARPLRSYHLARPAEERSAVARLLEQVGLVPAADFLGRYPHELSGGQRQRVGIARALAVEPSLLLADEPTSMLDVSIRLTIMNLLRDLQASSAMTLVFITHDLAGAYYISDRIAILYAGRLLELGPATEVMGEPRHPYTQLLRHAAPDPARQFGRDQRFEGHGDPPDLAALPPGCPFAPRCPHVSAACRDALPPLYAVGAAHTVRCVLYA